MGKFFIIAGTGAFNDIRSQQENLCIRQLLTDFLNDPAVNPSSEKPKFGKGREKGELKLISHAYA